MQVILKRVRNLFVKNWMKKKFPEAITFSNAARKKGYLYDETFSFILSALVFLILEVQIKVFSWKPFIGQQQHILW